MRIASDAVVVTVQFSSDGAAVHGLCVDSKLRTWDVASGAVRKTIGFDQDELAPVLAAGTLTTVAKDGTLRSWDLTTGKATKRIASVGRHTRRALNAADGTVVLSNSGTMIQLRSLDASGKEKFVVPSGLGGLGALAVSPDGQSVVAASYDADMRAWNAKNGELLRLIDELPVSMFDLKFSPDGQTLAAAGADRIVYLYDTKSWKMKRKLSGQPEMISALAFSPDGSRIASGGFSELTLKNPVKVLVWDVATEKVLQRFDAPQRVSSVAFAPDGKHLAVATATKSVDIWQVGG